MENIKIINDDLKRALDDEENFSSCVFESCDFTNCNLTGKEFRECVFDRCNLALCKLANATLIDIEFTHSKLVGSDFSAVRKPAFSQPFILFDDCLVDLCNFSGLPMKGAKFDGCTVRNCTFGQTNLSQASFDRTDLEGTTFHHADLTKADFSSAKNYAIDPTANTLKKTRFSLPEAVSLLRGFDIELV